MPVKKSLNAVARVGSNLNGTTELRCENITFVTKPRKWQSNGRFSFDKLIFAVKKIKYVRIRQNVGCKGSNQKIRRVLAESPTRVIREPDPLIEAL